MIIIRRAVKEDNEALVALARKTPMGGNISVRIDREPDFFRMIRARGGGTVLVACDGPVIVGTISSSIRPFVLSGQCTRVAFVADFRVHPDLKGRGIAYRLCRAMGDHLRKDGPEWVTAMIADGNERAMAFLQGRMKLPKFRSLGKFTSYQLFPSARRVDQGPYQVRMANKNEYEEINHVRQDFNKKYMFYSAAEFRPKNDEKEMGESQTRVQNSVAIRNGQIVATLGLHDANDLKQIVIIRLPWPLRIVTTILRWTSGYLPIPKFPRMYQPVRILYLRHLAYRTGHEQAAKILIKSARKAAYEKNCLFAMIGFHERDAAKNLLNGIPKLKFVSQGFMTSTKNEGRIPSSLDNATLLEDFSLV